MPTKAESRYIAFEALAASTFAFDESKVNRKGGKFAKKGEKHSQKSLSGMGYSGPHGGTNYDKSHSQGIHSVSLGDGGIVDKEINYPRSNGSAATPKPKPQNIDGLELDAPDLQTDLDTLAWERENPDMVAPKFRDPNEPQPLDAQGLPEIGEAPQMKWNEK